MRFFLSLVALALLSTASLADDAAFRSYLSKLGEKSALKAVEKSIEVNERAFKGTIKAVDPSRNLKIDVKEFSFDDDTLSAEVHGRVALRLDGTLTEGDVSVNVVVEATFKPIVTAEAKLVEREGEFFVTPKAKDIQFDVEITTIEPDKINSAKKTLSSLAEAAFKNRKDQIIQRVNEELGETKIEF